jgi:hypothetical protein
MGIDRTVLDRREQILRIASESGGRNVRIFGSRARGEVGPESDIDVLIDLEPGRSLLDIVAIQQDLEDLLGCRAHVVTESAISHHFRDRALKEAVAL